MVLFTSKFEVRTILYNRNQLELTHYKAAELYEEAAEMATMNMKGKLAAKYFEKAELAWGEVE